MTATLQFDPEEHTADALKAIVEAPEKWPPPSSHKSLYRLSRQTYAERATFINGYLILARITTNTSAVCFL